MSKKFNEELFQQMPIVGIMRNFPEEHLMTVVREFHSAGLTTLEITMNSGNPTDDIRQLRSDWGDQLNVGAGTVCSMKDLDRALDAGAQFIVAPVTNKKIIKTCVDVGIPVFPGAYTPTEIHNAWKWGATMVKVFPATTLGPGYIKDVLEPLNKVKLLPTGGITKDNFTEYLAAGAKGVGMAGGLFPKAVIAAARWPELRSLYSDLVSKYNLFQNGTTPSTSPPAVETTHAN